MISKLADIKIRKIKDYLTDKPIVKAWLFGSYSRGEERKDSDIDLLVEFDANVHISLLKYAGFVCDLEELLNCKVDLVENGYLLPFAQNTAEHDKILIYDRAS